MRKLELNGQFVDLSSEEMLCLEGGESWVVTIFYFAGRAIGELSKIQKYSGDNGQWMA